MRKNVFVIAFVTSSTSAAKACVPICSILADDIVSKTTREFGFWQFKAGDFDVGKEQKMPIYWHRTVSREKVNRGNVTDLSLKVLEHLPFSLDTDLLSFVQIDAKYFVCCILQNI